MSHIGIGGNLIQPNKQCLSCKYWEPAHKSYFGFSIGGGCKAGYCKKRGYKEMIKIIKPGYRKEVECIKCGALLSYDEKEDVQKEESKISAGGQGFAVNAGRYIICPQCKNKIMLSAAR